MRRYAGIITTLQLRYACGHTDGHASRRPQLTPSHFVAPSRNTSKSTIARMCRQCADFLLAAGDPAAPYLFTHAGHGVRPLCGRASGESREHRKHRFEGSPQCPSRHTGISTRNRHHTTCRTDTLTFNPLCQQLQMRRLTQTPSLGSAQHCTTYARSHFRALRHAPKSSRNPPTFLQND